MNFLRRCIILAATLVLPLLMAASNASDPRENLQRAATDKSNSPLITFEEIAGTGQIDTRSTQAECALPYPGDLGLQLFGEITGEESYFRFQDIDLSTCEPTLPIGIIGLQFVVCVSSACTTQISFEIYDAAGIECPQPGALLYETATGLLTSPGGPTCGVVTALFTDTLCISGDFFISYKLNNPVSCFDMFVDTLPGPCTSYRLKDGTLSDLFDQGYPGQVWIRTLAVDNFDATCAFDFIDIPRAYEWADSLDGMSVSIVGEFISDQVPLFVTDYAAYKLDTPMPPWSNVFITGAYPPSDYWYGGLVVAHGILSVDPILECTAPLNDKQLSLSVSGYDLIHPFGLEGGTAKAAKAYSPHPPVSSSLQKLDDCDSCKVAVLISGGIDEAKNKEGYWATLEKNYDYLVNSANLCPENIWVLYYDGVPGSAGIISVPDNRVFKCSRDSINWAYDQAAARLANCDSSGIAYTFVGNHGVLDPSDPAKTGTCLLCADSVLTPAELRANQQKLIDSGADSMFVELTHCFSGIQVEDLKSLADSSETEIHVNSPALGSLPVPSQNNIVHDYVRCKLDSLATGRYSYEECVTFGMHCFKDTLMKWLDDALDDIDSLKLLDSTGFLFSDQRANVRRQIRNREYYRDVVQGVLDTCGTRFYRIQFNEYCDSRTVTAPKGGQLCFKFSGTGTCGNVRLYEKKEGVDDPVQKREWNWNLPGSNEFVPGNDTRYYDVDTGSSGVFILHNDGSDFTVEVVSTMARFGTDSPSNPISYAGGSRGFRDGSSEEFGEGPFSDPHGSSGTFNDDSDLGDCPRDLGSGGSSGVNHYIASFDIPADNVYWSDMEVVLDVLTVLQPGPMTIECPQAANSVVPLTISGPGRYTAHLGAIATTGGSGEIEFVTSFSGASFEFDSWGLRSLVETFPPYLCGDADGSTAVSIGDAVFIINYIFAGGPAPNPLASGDADCSGAVSISDAVYLINFIFAGGPAPCAACP